MRRDTFIFVRSKYKGRVPKRKIRRDILPLIREGLFFPSFCSFLRLKELARSLAPLRSVDLRGCLEMSQTVIFGLLLERIATRRMRGEGQHNRGNISQGCNKFPNDTTMYSFESRERRILWTDESLSIFLYLSCFCALFHISSIYDCYRLMIDASFFHGELFIKDIFDKLENDRIYFLQVYKIFLRRIKYLFLLCCFYFY